MKRAFSLCAAALMLTLALPVSALAAETAAVCYPTSVTRSEDGTELKKIYDLAPEEDPAGIPRSDFEQDGFRYTLTDLLKQDLPEHEERQHTETVSLPSKNKDMASVLALLPQEREFVTDDGLMGTLTLQLDTVRVEVAGYGSSTKEISATRSYPNLAGQDTQYIPKTIEENGKTLWLSSRARPSSLWQPRRTSSPPSSTGRPSWSPLALWLWRAQGSERRSSSGAAVRRTMMAASPPDGRNTP